MPTEPRDSHATTTPARARRSLAPALWLLAAAIVAAFGRPWSAGPDTASLVAGLVPAELRASPGTFVVLRRRAVGDDAWARVGDTLGPQLPEHRPLAPPPAEARAWFGAHLLYWVDDADRPALARRFEPAALRAAIAGVRARLASPLFGVGDDDVRSDPLQLRGLASLGGLHAPPVVTPTASGDLMSADGSTLLIHLQTAEAPEAVAATVSAQLSAQFSSDSPEVADIEIRALTVGGESPQATNPTRGIIANLALLTFILALVLRRLRASLAVIAMLAVGAPLVAFVAGPLTLALLGVAAAFASRPLVARAAWLPVAAALLPLLLLPYPAWQRQALLWPLATAILAFGVHLVLPAVQRLLHARPSEPPPPARPLPPAVALAVCTILVVGGAAWLGRVPVDRVVAETPATLVGLRDTANIAELHSRGDTPAAALAAAARDTQVVAAAVPGARFEGPGRYVLDEATLAARAADLAALDLPGRVEFLRGALAEHGLRPDAFGEFFRALDPARQPSPEAALLGPLGSWLQASLRTEDPGGVVAMTHVHLPAQLPDVLPAQLHGPAVFDHEDRREFPARLALALIAGAWLSAFLTWLSVRRLAPALTAAIVGAAAQVGALISVAMIHGEISPLLLPALLIVGAASAVTTAAACDALAGPRAPLAPACLAAPGLVLLLGDDPTWHATGVALALGAALGGLLATHAGPGLCALLQRREVRP